MGLKGFLVELDSPSNAYYSGRAINGKVIFELDKPKVVRGVRVEVKGVEKTAWTKTERRHSYGSGYNGREGSNYVTVHYSGDSVVMDKQFYVLGSSNDKMELKQGLHQYPFKTTLSSNIPSSYEGSYGSIRYTLKAVLDRPWKFDNEVKVSFTVVQWVDLNQNSDATSSVTEEDEETFCCLCCKSRPLEVGFTLPYSGFVPNQGIPVSLNIKNSSNVGITSIDVELERESKFVASFPRYSRKYSSFTVSSVTLPGVNPMSSKSFTSELAVPSKQHPDISNGSLITAWYNLKVTARVSGCHRNFNLSTSIYIGTVPVYRPPSQFDTVYGVV